MSNQNKTTIRKTLLTTAIISSLSFLTIAHSGEPELITKDEVLENVEPVETETKQEVSTADTLKSTSEKTEATPVANDSLTEEEKTMDAKSESKCGG